jgi:hypothetical protein
VLSVAAFHVSVLTRFQYFEEATRIQGWGAFFFSIAAIVSAIIVVPLAVYHIRDLAQNPGHPITWLALGAGFGVLTPLFSGGFSRAASAFTGLAEGHLEIGDFFQLMLDAVLVFPYDFVVEGALNLIVGLEFGVLFAVFGFIIDRINTSKNETVAAWVPWIFTAVAGLTVLLFSLLAPTEFLRDLAS